MPVKILYCVKGTIQGKGTGLRKPIHEHTQAYSPAQARRNVATQLQQQLKEEIYLGVCETDLYTNVHKESKTSW